MYLFAQHLGITKTIYHTLTLFNKYQIARSGSNKQSETKSVSTLG